MYRPNRVPERLLRLALACLLLVLAPLLPHSASSVWAEDRKEESEGTLRLFHVHALVAGQHDYVGHRLGLVGPDQQNDEARPLFGFEGDERVQPVGGVDDLIELLKAEVDPASWQTVSGATLNSLRGGTLLVRNLPATHVALGAALKRYEDRWLRPITVEVVAVNLPPESGRGRTLSAEVLAALAANPMSGPALSLTLLPGQRSVAYAGQQISYVGDYDVEVAQKASISDPIVQVCNLGLAVDVRAVPSAAGDRVLLGLECRLAQVLERPVLDAGDGRKVEAPVVAMSQARVVHETPVGAWSLVDGAAVTGTAAPCAFLVRVRVGTRASGPATSGAVLPEPTSAGLGRFGYRDYDIDQLTLPIRNVSAQVPKLWPSNYTPPEPPEVPEATPALDAETLVELTRQAVAPESWEREGASLESRKGVLIARAPEPVLLAIGRLLAALKREFLWAVDVDVEVVQAPADLALGSEVLLSEASLQALDKALAEGGTARRLERARVTSMHGARNAIKAGTERPYLQDFEVEIAEDSAISNPVLQFAFSGLVVDVEPALSSSSDSAKLAVRIGRSVLEQPMRTFGTDHGPVQTPTLRVFSLSTDLDVPFGRTALVGATTEAGVRTLVLLTPRLRRAGE